MMEKEKEALGTAAPDTAGIAAVSGGGGGGLRRSVCWTVVDTVLLLGAVAGVVTAAACGHHEYGRYLQETSWRQTDHCYVRDIDIMPRGLARVVDESGRLPLDWKDELEDGGDGEGRHTPRDVGLGRIRGPPDRDRGWKTRWEGHRGDDDDDHSWEQGEKGCDHRGLFQGWVGVRLWDKFDT